MGRLYEWEPFNEGEIFMSLSLNSLSFIYLAIFFPLKYEPTCNVTVAVYVTLKYFIPLLQLYILCISVTRQQESHRALTDSLDSNTNTALQILVKMSA